MRKRVWIPGVLGLLLTVSIPVSASIDWCGGGTPPGLGVKDDQTHPAFARVAEKAGFSLHEVNPFSGNTAKTTAADTRNPVDPGTLPADATLGPH